MHSLHAVAEKSTFSIEAAISSLPPNVKRLMAAADIVLAARRSVSSILTKS
jgi:hypothetical protein